MYITRLLLSTTVLVAVSTAVLAEDGNVYLGLGAGAGFEHDAKFTRNAGRTTVDFDWGWSGEAALGYRYGNGLRTELEVSYRGNNDVDSVSGSLTKSGDSKSWAGMVNVLYDIDMFDNTRFMPYIGVGAGIVHSEYNRVGPTLGLNAFVDDTSTDFGYQGIIGMTYRATDVIDLYANYKYMSALDPQYSSVAVTDIDGEYDVSTIMAGLRFNLNAPAQAPVVAEVPPAPVPESSRTYLVFFDFDRSDLTPEARDVLRQAAADALNGAAIKLEVRGHADRSGSDRYNEGLSAKRAKTVQTELARLGVPTGEIETRALGEKEPLVPTADGIKEPQNRRAEVVFFKK